MKYELKQWVLLAVALLIVCIGSPADIMAHERFDVKLSSLQRVYRVGESIELTARGNRDFYLYLFTVDEDNQVGYLLAPGDGRHSRKYRADKRYTVPGNGVQIISDEPGIERIIMLASVEPVDLPEQIVAQGKKQLQGLRVVRGNPVQDYCIKELDIIVR